MSVRRVAGVAVNPLHIALPRRPRWRVSALRSLPPRCPLHHRDELFVQSLNVQLRRSQSSAVLSRSSFWDRMWSSECAPGWVMLPTHPIAVFWEIFSTWRWRGLMALPVRDVIILLRAVARATNGAAELPRRFADWRR